MKEKLYLTASVIDSFISISLLLVGMYVFFWEKNYLSGAIIFGCHSLYSIERILCKKYLED